MLVTYRPWFSASSVPGSSADETKFETSTKCEADIASIEFSMFPVEITLGTDVPVIFIGDPSQPARRTGIPYRLTRFAHFVIPAHANQASVDLTAFRLPCDCNHGALRHLPSQIPCQFMPSLRVQQRSCNCRLPYFLYRQASSCQVCR